MSGAEFLEWEERQPLRWEFDSFAPEGIWVGHIVSGNAVLAMPETGIEVPPADLYEGVSFEDTPGAAVSPASKPSGTRRRSQ
jgi:hypothetical protein